MLWYSVSYNWCLATVADILSKQEYYGDAVNFRSTAKSFKNKTIIERPQEEWKIFPNTHPGVIDRWCRNYAETTSALSQNDKKRNCQSVFRSSLLCGLRGKFYYSVTNNYKREQAYFFYSVYRKNLEVCSLYYIRGKVVTETILESMRKSFWMCNPLKKNLP